jgi:hypothetical protein
MANDAFHLQNTTTLDWTINGTDYAVAAAQDVAVSISTSRVDLSSGDSIFRESHYHENMRFPVSISQARFDHGFITEIFGSPAAANNNVIEDRSQIPPLKLSGDFDAGERGSSKTVTLTVEDIAWPEDMPLFDLSTGEYGNWDIESEGATLSEFTVTT